MGRHSKPEDLKPCHGCNGRGFRPMAFPFSWNGPICSVCNLPYMSPTLRSGEGVFYPATTTVPYAQNIGYS